METSILKSGFVVDDILYPYGEVGYYIAQLAAGSVIVSMNELNAYKVLTIKGAQATRFIAAMANFLNEDTQVLICPICGECIIVVALASSCVRCPICGSKNCGE